MFQDRGDWKRRRFGLIPKPLSHTAGETINDKKVLRDWRLDFKDQEKYLITHQRKPMIKLLKAFRFEHYHSFPKSRNYAPEKVTFFKRADKMSVLFQKGY